MKNLTHFFAVLLVILSVALGAGNALGAGTYPEKPIILIVPASAGGGSDIFSRTFASSAEKDKLLPQPVVVENKAGAGGGLAFAYVAGKKKDPYFLVAAVAAFITAPLTGMSPFSVKDFTPIANFAFDEYMLMVGPNSKYKSMKEVIDAAKANPKKVTVGGVVLGASDSICAYLMEKAMGIQLNYIVFNGGGEVNAALLGGHIDIAIGNPGEALELYKAGKVNILGIFSEKRLVGAPNIPTMKEQGINVVYVQNRGICAPADIPEGARTTLEQASFKYTKTETFKKYVAQNMLSEAWMDGATYGKFIDEWSDKYAVILKDMNLLKKK